MGVVGVVKMRGLGWSGDHRVVAAASPAPRLSPSWRPPGAWMVHAVLVHGVHGVAHGELSGAEGFAPRLFGRELRASRTLLHDALL